MLLFLFFSFLSFFFEMRATGVVNTELRRKLRRRHVAEEGCTWGSGDSDPLPFHLIHLITFRGFILYSYEMEKKRKLKFCYKNTPII